MTRKDYILIAGEMNATLLAEPNREVSAREFVEGFAACVSAVASALKSDNPNFDVERFMDAVMEVK